MATDDPSVAFNRTHDSAWVLAEELPVDVLLSVPEDFFAPSTVKVGLDAELIAGVPGETRDFVFRVLDYATEPDAEGLYERDDYSAMVGASYQTGPDSSTYNPLRIYVVPV